MGHVRDAPITSYIMALEPFLLTIHANPIITSITVGGHQHKVSAYADDLNLFLSNPDITIPNLLTDFSLYAELSNLYIK